jgi:hypothetical protein
MSTYRLLWWSLALPLVSLGVAAAVVTSSVLTVLVVFGLVAFCLGLLGTTLQSLDREGRRCQVLAPSRVANCGCVGGIAALALYGLSTVVGDAAVLIVVFMAATWPVAVPFWLPRGLSFLRRL